MTQERTPAVRRANRGALTRSAADRGAHSPKRRRGGRLTEAREQEIMRKAASLFIKKGYEVVTIDDIIALLGGSKRTIYARFGGKEGLFETVIKQHCAKVDIAIDIDVAGDIEAQLTAIGRAFLNMVLHPRTLELHRLMVSIGKTFPSVGRLFYEKGPQSAYSIVTRWIERQQAANKLADGDARRLATLFLDMLLGEQQLALLLSVPKTSSPQAIDETVHAAVSLFLRGTAPR
jgi:TetR/AcrR family transcriptional repressor of mexJK operon